MEENASVEEMLAMKELYAREISGHTFSPVPRVVALALESKGWAKTISEAPPTFRLTDTGKKILGTK